MSFFEYKIFCLLFDFFLIRKNADDIYPLHMAASEGQVDCLKLLLQLKPDASVTDKRGQTPLDLAKLWGHRMCAK